MKTLITGAYGFDFLNAGDVGIASLLPDIKGTGVSNKSYTYLAAGKLIIVIMDKDTEIALMVKENNVDWVVNPDNFSELSNLIIQLKNDRRQIKENLQPLVYV